MNKNLLTKHKNIHFIGIGGIGQSALAGILLERGFCVSGSDLSPSHITKRLKAKGAKIYKGHSAGNVKEADLVVYSSAVPKDCPEMKVAREKKIEMMKRGELLALMMNPQQGIAVSGSHGKTTTSALICFLLEKAGFHPSFTVGAELKNFDGKNYANGESDYFIAETDESDGSFLYVKPKYTIVTNIEREHMDYFKNMDSCINAYKKFIDSTKDGGSLFLGIDCNNIRELSKNLKKNKITFGLRDEADFYPEDIELSGLFSRFTCYFKGKRLGKIFLPIPGIHNVLNSLACIALGMDLGIDFDIIASAVKAYQGAGRRFEVKGCSGGIMVIEDYAHHPTEIKATIQAARNLKSKRLLGIFQPHRYSRTLHLKEEYAGCFDGLDQVILTDVYSASEQPIEGVSGRLVYDKVKASGFENVRFLPKHEILNGILPELKKGDSVLVLGAGDIGELSEKILQRLKEKKDV